jgi:hypothetical protein
MAPIGTPMARALNPFCRSTNLVTADYGPNVTFNLHHVVNLRGDADTLPTLTPFNSFSTDHAIRDLRRTSSPRTK